MSGESETILDVRASFRAAVITTTERLIPGHGSPDGRHLALLAEAPAPAPPRAWNDTAALTLAAILAARARCDVLTGGADFLALYFDGVRLLRPAALSSGARALLLSAAGEYCCALGSAYAGARFAEEALLFCDTDALEYQALSTLYLARALNGENLTADAAARRARELFRRRRWSIADTSYTLLLADVLSASARIDADGLARAALTLATFNPDNPYWQFTAQAVEVMRLLVVRDYAGALASCRFLLHGSRQSHSHRMVRQFLMCIRTDALVCTGEYNEALAALAPAETHEGHGVCFHMMRSECLLLLGRDRDALAETEECVTDTAGHCLRTLTPIYLHRAVAFHRMGNARRAAQSMEAALLLLDRAGGALIPFFLVPLAETVALFDIVGAMRPDLNALIAPLRLALPAMAAPVVPEVGPPLPLTRTERELAHVLASPQSLVDIARGRGVSLNTVKSQVRSIYAKLGVGRRAEAVEELSRRLY